MGLSGVVGCCCTGLGDVEGVNPVIFVVGTSLTADEEGEETMDEVADEHKLDSAVDVLTGTRNGRL